MEYNNPDDYWMRKEDERQGGWWPYFVCFFAFVLVLVCVAMCSGCSPKVIERVEKEYIVKKDSVLMRDSVWVKDSVFVEKAGDTITEYRTRDRYIYKYVDKVRVDSFIKRDSIPYPVEIEKPLTKWETFCIDYGKIMLGATVVCIIFIVIKLRFLHV